jgi:hypothetical protein
LLYPPVNISGIFFSFTHNFVFIFWNNLSPMFLTNKQNAVSIKYLLQPQTDWILICTKLLNQRHVKWSNMCHLASVTSLWMEHQFYCLIFRPHTQQLPTIGILIASHVLVNYHMLLNSTKVMYCQMWWKDDYKCTGNEAQWSGLSYFKILTQHLTGGIKENYIK